MQSDDFKLDYASDTADIVATFPQPAIDGTRVVILEPPVVYWFRQNATSAMGIIVIIVWCVLFTLPASALWLGKLYYGNLYFALVLSIPLLMSTSFSLLFPNYLGFSRERIAPELSRGQVTRETRGRGVGDWGHALRRWLHPRRVGLPLLAVTIRPHILNIVIWKNYDRKEVLELPLTNKLSIVVPPRKPLSNGRSLCLRENNGNDDYMILHGCFSMYDLERAAQFINQAISAFSMNTES